MVVIWHGERRSETLRQDGSETVTIQSDPLPGRSAKFSNVIDWQRRQLGCSSEVVGTLTGSVLSVRCAR
jgi:hypothetical protein